MWRSLHSFLALATLLPVLLLSLTGTFLAVVPVADALSPTVQQPGALSVADVLGVLEQFDEPDRLDRLPSGTVTLTAFGPDGPEKHVVDIRTGASLGLYSEDAVVMFIKELHRSLTLGYAGRLVAGFTALVMGILCISGLALLLRRQGGWRGLLAPVRGRAFEKLHAVSGRLSLLPLLFMAVTALYLSLVTFGALPNGQETPPAVPESLAELDPVAPSQLAGLQAIPFANVKSVIFPVPGDWFDVFSVTTGTDHIFIDQFTGVVLASEPLRPAQIGLDWIKALHTGEGIAPLAVLLGLSSLGVPIFAVSGVAIWLGGRRRAGRRVPGNCRATDADIAVLVGSENGSTWGFARHLHGKLTALGQCVHLDSLASFSSYPKASRVLVLTSTYGDGHAPQSAQGFLGALERHTARPSWKFAVLGFGDSSFPDYCRFARDADSALAQYAERLLPHGSIDRESAQSFAGWGAQLRQATGLDVMLDYVPPRPQTSMVVLVERKLYGEATGTPTAILRFAPSQGSTVPAFRPGDLVGVVPPNSSVARFYSPASGAAGGYLEICVRRLEGGYCSGFLHDLPLGGTADIFIRANPDFHAPRRPLILVAAGTGITPFAGVIRANKGNRPIELFWGGRDPASDFLYEEEIETWLADGRLTHFAPIFSRSGARGYVQDRLRQDGKRVAGHVRDGAAIMVCGSREMSLAVRQVIDDILAGSALNVASLRAKHRYLEDIY